MHYRYAIAIILSGAALICADGAPKNALAAKSAPPNDQLCWDFSEATSGNVELLERAAVELSQHPHYMPLSLYNEIKAYGAGKLVQEFAQMQWHAGAGFEQAVVDAATACADEHRSDSSYPVGELLDFARDLNGDLWEQHLKQTDVEQHVHYDYLKDPVETPGGLTITRCSIIDHDGHAMLLETLKNDSNDTMFVSPRVDLYHIPSMPQQFYGDWAALAPGKQRTEAWEGIGFRPSQFATIFPRAHCYYFVR